MIIDTHCHLDFDEFSADTDAVIERANDAGVGYLINVGSSLAGSRRSVELAERYKNVFATVGIHPHHAGENVEDAFGEIEKLSTHEKVVAIGEVGLDYFKSPAGPDRQKALFIKSIELSTRRKLPLVIHNREAGFDTLRILEKNSALPVRGVMHCFSGDREFLERSLSLGLFLSFTGILTFKNSNSLRELAKHVPLDRLLLETDAPFLAPQAHRGKRNEPAYITELRDTLSSVLGIPAGEIDRVTARNAGTLFKLPI